MVIQQRSMFRKSKYEVSEGPIRIVEIELGHPIFSLISAAYEGEPDFYQQVLCLVRLHGLPLGVVTLPLPSEGLSLHTYLPLFWERFGQQINQHLKEDELPTVDELLPSGVPGFGEPKCQRARKQFLTDAPFVSVIIPTHDRPDRLALCLHSILATHYPRFEILVVDNAPSTDATAELLQKEFAFNASIRYLREDRQGPSWARNCGMQAAKGGILAFVDDDVIVDPSWLAELARGFALFPDVACVTSLILPLKLDTAAQRWFEEYGGFCKGFVRQVYDQREYKPANPLYPYNAGSFGAGASMAFTAQFLRQVGGFDPALGGTGPARGGEDLAIFFQVIHHGYKLVYEPASLLYHLHRTDYAGLYKQMHNYGIGLTAYLTKNIVDHPRLLIDFLMRIPYGLFFLLSGSSPKNTKRSTSYPKALKKTELEGVIYGPLAYFQSRRMMNEVQRAYEKAKSNTQEHSQPEKIS
ncbi:glycosyltransferase [Tengunoibacter tsumagoiensis]|uniref:Glycosyltransferase 2-like domain-containing protein n=1 Tax=Tengunoibacter tsumagoiensis TaxID=2014871 RepID=A0A402A0H7_9CHLR|nr:glycosyltransferase [Tengunoibacter tsumagoiensis]GCE12658.1 hypothetical protein KTT_25170 [Tengunoibacter tsumagoiensis]